MDFSGKRMCLINGSNVLLRLCMVKDETIELRYKIKSTSEVLRTESPTKIARAILDGLNPPDLTEKALVCRIQRLIAQLFRL